MTEWHLSPEYILDNWTNEEMNLMVTKLVERKNRKSATLGSDRVVSDIQFFRETGIKVQKVNRGN